ncbi:hypothetical protein JCM17380_49040 [Desulfosporosinus burensis]
MNKTIMVYAGRNSTSEEIEQSNGQEKGRGRMDREKEYALSRKFQLVIF